MTIALVRTRRPLHLRLLARLNASYLRWLIRHAEKVLAGHRKDLEQALTHYPAQIDLDQAYIDSLAKMLTRAVNEL